MWAKCIAFGDTFGKLGPTIFIYISKISNNE